MNFALRELDITKYLSDIQKGSGDGSLTHKLSKVALAGAKEIGKRR